MAKKRKKEFEYDVCLSFAGNDRAYVQKVAEVLRGDGVRVFYDKYDEAGLWGKDLYSHLADVYTNAARYCVMFVSRHYARRLWTNHERRSAQARAFRENEEYVLPARFDGTTVPGLPETVSYVDLRRTKPKGLASLIGQKLGPRQRTNYFPPVPDRLFDSLGIARISKQAKEAVDSYARNFFHALERMTHDERFIIYQLVRRGCPADLPENMHINVDLLRRVTEFTPRKIKSLLGGLRSRGFFLWITKEKQQGGVWEIQHCEG
jgi:hypothetical protein